MTQTLGQYFFGLRESIVPFSPLARETVEAMTDETLLPENWCVRHWGMPGKARKVAWNARGEWNAYFLRQQHERRGLSMDKVAERAGVDTVTVWKIENDKGVKTATVRPVL